MKLKRSATAVVMLLLLGPVLSAQVRLPRLVRDSMILQRDQPIKIWGWAAKYEKVSVRFAGKTYKAKADGNGNWSTMLLPMKAGGPFTMDISGKNKIILKEILVGDVWFCSGQSNMVHQMNIHDVTYAKDIESANYPAIRQFWIPTLTNLQGPQGDLPTGYWKWANPVDVRPFSAVAYFFARDLYERYHVPIGIINSSVGGTPIEAWTSEEGLKDFSVINELILKNRDTAYVNQTNRAAAASVARNPSKDLGMLETVKWYEVSYSPKNWKNINVPGYWEDQGIKDLNGVVWYRKEVDIPVSMTGKQARVFLGRIVDADELYINGQQVGRTTYLYPQRRYSVPANILKAGKNIFVVRVTNNNGKGGFVPDKPYCIFSGTDTVSLKGEWQYKVGEVFLPPANKNPVFSINAQNQPTALYNAMVAPVIPYAVKGILWYQGEANTNRAAEYSKHLPALINDWRKKWNYDLPFLYVQLPGFMDMNYLPSESQWAVLRESQLQSLSVPNTAMAVAIDLGEWNDIHPDNKKDVGLRLALAARKLVYKEDLVCSGPIFHSYQKEGNRIILSFIHIGTGLTTSDGEDPAEFAIAGADKKFVWAKAKIERDKVIVWNELIPEPMYIRYAWADCPVNPNLFNKEGLPASPFRTDK